MRVWFLFLILVVSMTARADDGMPDAGAPATDDDAPATEMMGERDEEAVDEEEVEVETMDEDDADEGDADEGDADEDNSGRDNVDESTSTGASDDDEPNERGSVARPTASTGSTRALQQTRLPNLPTQVRFKDLSKLWRRFTLRNKNQTDYNPYDGGGGRWGPAYEQVLNDMGIGVHFTKGDNVIIGKESYLVTYRVDLGMEPQELQQEIQARVQQIWGHGHGAAQPPRPAGKFSPRAYLKLALLNLRNVGDLEDLRAFDPKQDLLAPADLREMSQWNLRQLGTLIRQFMRYDYGGGRNGLPLRDARTLRNMLQNYFHANVAILRDPATNQPYHLNTALNGKKSNIVGNEKTLPIVYEASPSSDNTRGVLFMDGHAERVPEWKWQQVRAAKIAPPTPQQWRRLSNETLQRLGNMVRNYRYHGGNARLKFESDYQAQRALQRYYGRTPAAYREPQSGKSYRFNKAISNLELHRATNSNKVVIAYEPQPGNDGKIGAVFLDGRVRRVAAKDWTRVLSVKPKLRAKANRNEDE